MCKENVWTPCSISFNVFFFLFSTIPLNSDFVPNVHFSHRCLCTVKWFWFLTVTAGRAVECAQALAKASLHPVHVVRGGFQRFSALYPFLRTEKIIYTVTVIKHNTCPGPSYTHHYTCEVHLSLPSGSGLQSSDLDSTLFRHSPYGSHSSEYLLYYYYYFYSTLSPVGQNNTNTSQ